MTPKDFLSLFWGDAGQVETARHTNITTINPRVIQFWSHTEGQFDQAVNAYFAPAVFGARSRTQIQAVGAWALWLDVDVKDGHHADFEALHAAVNQFVDGLKLPYPLLVKSGAGIHVYFLCSSIIPRELWNHLAKCLRAVCDTAGFVADHKRTEDIASLMRLPGTINQKPGRGALPVEVIEDSDRPYAISDIKVLKRVFEPYAPRPIKPPSKLSQRQETLATIEMTSAPDGMRYSAAQLASVCGQLGVVAAKCGDVSEPLWYAALQTLRYVEDSGRHAIAWSEGHPGYDESELLKKMKQLTSKGIGPATCEHLARVGDKDICQRCAFRTTVNTPLQAATPAFNPDEGGRIPQEVRGQFKDYTVNVQEPYYIDSSGAVMKQGGSGEGILIHSYPIFVHRRYRESDAQWYFSLLCATHRDGVREIRVSAGTLANYKSFYSELAAAGVLSPDMVSEKRGLFTYVYFCAEQAWKGRDVVDFYAHYGWDAAHETFNLGVTHYTEEGSRHGEFTEDAAPTVPPKDHSLKPWSKVIEHYINAPLAFRLAFFSSFAAPLMYMTGLNGVLYSLFSPASGVGKTTVLNCATSIWGDPEYIGRRKSDTMNSLLHFAGVAHSLPVCVDEFSCAKLEDFQQFLYELSGGQERARLTKDIKQRKGGSWNTLFMATTNSALTSQLPVGDNFEGLSARLIEAQVFEYTTPDVLKEVNETAVSNWGVIGHLWAAHVVQHRARLEADTARLMSSVQQQKPGMYRYYAAFISTTIIAMREVGSLLDIRMGVGRETLEDFVKLFIPGVIMAQGYKGGVAGARDVAHIAASYREKVAQRIVGGAFTAGKYQTIQPEKKIGTLAALGTAMHTYTVLEDKEYLVVAESLCAPLRAAMPELMERVHILPGGAYTMDTRIGVPAYRISKAAMAGLREVKTPTQEKINHG